MYPDGFATKIVPEGPAIVGPSRPYRCNGQKHGECMPLKQPADRAVHAASASGIDRHTGRRSPSSGPAAGGIPGLR